MAADRVSSRPTPSWALAGLAFGMVITFRWQALCMPLVFLTLGAFGSAYLLMDWLRLSLLRSTSLRAVNSAFLNLSNCPQKFQRTASILSGWITSRSVPLKKDLNPAEGSLVC